MVKTAQDIQGSLRDYLQIIFHRKWFFAMPFVIVFCTATIGSFFLPKYYQSSVLILVEEEKSVNPLATKEVPYLSTSGQPPTLTEQLKTLTEKILSYPHLLTLVKTLDMDKDAADQIAFERLLIGIRKRSEVKMKSPDVFQVSYEDKDPVTARNAVRVLKDLFVDENRSKKSAQAKTAVKFSEDQAKVYKKKLEDSEKALYEYRAQYPMQQPGKELDYNISLLTNYQTSLTTVEMNLKEAQNKIDLIKRQLAGKESVIISSDVLDLNPAVSRLNSKLQGLQSDLDDRMSDNPDSPEIVSLQAQIDDTHEKLRLETEKMVESDTAQTSPLFYKRLEQKLKDAQRTVDDLKARKKNLEDLVKEYEEKIETLPEQEKELAKRTRDMEVNENIYKMLLLKAEENRLATAEIEEKGTKYTILEDARIPLKPSKPEILLIGIVAFILAVLSGFGCVFLAEFSDHSFRGVEDAKSFLKFEILGGIAAIADRGETMAQRARQRTVIILIVILYVVFFSFAAISSGIKQEQVRNRVIQIVNAEKSAEVKQNGK